MSDGLLDRIEIDIAAPSEKGSIQVRLDSPHGEKVGEVSIRRTGGGYDKYRVHQGDCEQLSGEHAIYLVFQGEMGLCNVKRFRFLKPSQKGSSEAFTKCQPIVISANETQKEIEKHRTRLITLHAPAGATVEVKQVAHHFEFGT